MASFTHQDVINAQTNAKIEIVDAKFNQFMDEMRDRDNRRAAEISELRTSIKDIYTVTDTKFSAIENKIDALSNNIHNMAVAAVIGVGAIVAAVVSILK